jgi:hypothetical protein
MTLPSVARQYVHPGAVAVDWGIPGVKLSEHAPMVAVCDQLMGAGRYRKVGFSGIVASEILK